MDNTDTDWARKTIKEAKPLTLTDSGCKFKQLVKYFLDLVVQNIENEPYEPIPISSRKTQTERILHSLKLKLPPDCASHSGI